MWMIQSLVRCLQIKHKISTLLHACKVILLFQNLRSTLLMMKFRILTAAIMKEGHHHTVLSDNYFE
jgi:hypothetical protein